MTQKLKFKVDGIKCESCPILIEDRLKNKDGIVKVKIDQNSCKGAVVFDEQKIDEKDIFDIIESINDFKIEKIEDTQEKQEIAKDNVESDLSVAEFSNIVCPFCKKHYSVKFQGEVVESK